MCVSDFWDTAGQETFNRMHPSYYYRAHCCILVFDVTRKITYQHLSDWYKELREYCPSIPCVLVANKIDVDYNVSTHRAPPTHTTSSPNGSAGDKEKLQIRGQIQPSLLLRVSGRRDQCRQGALCPSPPAPTFWTCMAWGGL